MGRRAAAVYCLSLRKGFDSQPSGKIHGQDKSKSSWQVHLVGVVHLDWATGLSLQVLSELVLVLRLSRVAYWWTKHPGSIKFIIHQRSYIQPPHQVLRQVASNARLLSPYSWTPLWSICSPAWIYRGDMGRSNNGHTHRLRYSDPVGV